MAFVNIRYQYFYLFIVLWRSYNQILLAFTVRFPVDSQSLGQIPGSLVWGLQPVQQHENLFDVTVFQFMDRTPSGYRILFYHDCAPPMVLLWFLLCTSMKGIFFWWVPMSSYWWLFYSCAMLCLVAQPDSLWPGVGCHFFLQCMKVKSESEVAQSCLTFTDPTDCSLPGSSIHGIFQARKLEWVAISSSNLLYKPFK